MGTAASVLLSVLESAAGAQLVADLGEQVELGRVGSDLDAGLTTLLQLLGRQDEHEVDDRSGDHEDDQRVDDGREVDEGVLLTADELETEALGGLPTGSLSFPACPAPTLPRPFSLSLDALSSTPSDL